MPYIPPANASSSPTRPFSTSTTRTMSGLDTPRAEDSSNVPQHTESAPPADNVEELSSMLEKAQLTAANPSQDSEASAEEGSMRKIPSSPALPGLGHASTTSESSASLASLAQSETGDGNLSILEMTSREGGESGISSPPTSVSTPDEVVLEDAVSRYREGLYAYTRSLYLQAKLVRERKEAPKQYGQFGLKQSGMERMAAKKALAKRLNG